MRDLANCVAVITGAGSGIGRALALQLAERDARLAVSDVNAEALQETASQLEQKGADVHVQTLDVSDRQAMFSYADTVAQRFGEVNLVINNAGVALASGLFSETSLEDFEWLMGINFSGVLYGTKAFMPYLEKSAWGHVVNISSVFGLIGVAEQTAYNSSKFAVRGLTEALRSELDMTGSTVSATSVHPGGVKTNIARSARVGEGLDDEAKKALETRGEDFDQLARTTAYSAAEQILEGVEKNRRRVLVGGDAKLLDRVQRLFPGRYHDLYLWLRKKTSGKAAFLSTVNVSDEGKAAVLPKTD